MTAPLKLLVVDDDAAARYGMRRALESEACSVREAASGELALELAAHESFEVVLLDVSMPGMGGVECLERLRALPAPPVVIMITAYGSERLAVDCLRRGAYDYLPKPYDVDELKAAVARASERERLVRENSLLKARLAAEPARFELGRSPAALEVERLIAAFAPTDVTLLVLGESGTGKELVAGAVHRLSPRSGREFVAVNCAALPEELVESELFGHEKGAFTGAAQARKGKFEHADGGTLFLDEIGDMTARTQTKVLRVLEERSFERLGSNATVHVDVRIIAATNRDLARDVTSGRFREDLYYRLKVAEVRIPPLRERPTDIPLLAEKLLEQAAARHGRVGLRLAPETLALLVAGAWPGNVRELKNALEYAVVLSDGEAITPASLPPNLRAGAPPRTGSEGQALELPYLEAKRLAVDAFNRAFLEARLGAVSGNVSEAARAMGLARQSLQAKLKELGIEPARFRGVGGGAAD